MSRMLAPESGVRVRMYRQGQGDCFLLAFPRDGADEDNPVYLLIDCGYMGGSQFKNVKLPEIIDHIADATGGFVDYVVITHEHADHVNGFNARDSKKKRHFDKIEFGQVWLAWTEDEDDPFANDLRERFSDQLVALALAEDHMQRNALNGATRDDVAQLLEIDFGSNAERKSFASSLKRGRKQENLTFAARKKIKGITNKTAIKYLRDTAHSGPVFLRPGQPAFLIGGATGAQVHVLGPPRNEKLLLSLDPQGDEEFHIGGGFALSGEASAFHLAMTESQTNGGTSPFAKRYAKSEKKVFKQKTGAQSTHDAITDPTKYNATVYCEAGSPVKTDDWRRIDGDWLRTANSLALRLNHEVNNTSLVLAFELPETGKVLLFSGDAQRGNWISWSNLTWDTPAGTETAKSLLGRCVFYKCGHHGSHNATLDGSSDDNYANLGWFAQGEFSMDFVAMIPVHSKWAKTKSGWNHPLESIEDALMKKARGRVFRNDLQRVTRPKPSDGHGKLTNEEWRDFKDRSIEGKLYKEYVVVDS